MLEDISYLFTPKLESFGQMWLKECPYRILSGIAPSILTNGVRKGLKTYTYCLSRTIYDAAFWSLFSLQLFHQNWHVCSYMSQST